MVRIQSASRLRPLQQGAGEMAGQSRALNTLLEFLASPTDPEAMQCLSFLWSMSGLRVCSQYHLEEKATAGGNGGMWGEPPSGFTQPECRASLLSAICCPFSNPFLDPRVRCVSVTGAALAPRQAGSPVLCSSAYCRVRDRTAPHTGVFTAHSRCTRTGSLHRQDTHRQASRLRKPCVGV